MLVSVTGRTLFDEYQVLGDDSYCHRQLNKYDAYVSPCIVSVVGNENGLHN